MIYTDLGTLEVTGLVTSMPLMDASLVAHLVRKPCLFPVGIVKMKKKVHRHALIRTSCFVHKTKPKFFNYISLTHRRVKWINDFEVSPLAFLSATAIVGDDFALWTFGNDTPEITDANQAAGQVSNLADPPKMNWILYTWYFRSSELLPNFPE